MKRIKVVSLLILSLFLAACATQSSIVKPDYNFRQIKRVAVIEFKDSSYQADSGSLVSDLFVKHLLRTGYSVIERSELESILKEHQLSVAGILNREQTKQFGKIAGVDAIITGSISLLVPERVYYDSGYPRFIAAQTGVTVRMIDVETGEILWAGSDTYDGMNTQTAFDYLVSGLVNQFMRDSTLNKKAD